MSYEQKDGSGTLFRAKEKRKDTSPDYTGDIMINGQLFWLSAWIKEGRSGKFMSVAIGQPKEQRGNPTADAPAPAPAKAKPKPDADFNDDLPFN